MARDGRREQQPREAKLTAIASFLNRDFTGVMTRFGTADFESERPSVGRHARI